MAIDLARVRAETPGCANVLHFNNAGAALQPQPVVDAVISHVRLEASIGGYEAAARVAGAVDHVYDAAAALIGARRSEIAIVDNATRAWDQAFYGIPLAAGDRILTGRNEYASNFIAYLQVTRRTGATVEVIPNDEYGQISIPALREAMDDRVKVIGLTHVQTSGGLVNPAAQVGQVAKESGALFLLDACQSVGHLRVDVDELGVDMLSTTGRKYLRGPRGTGFLYVRESVLDRLTPPVLDLHAATWVADDRYEMRPDARRFETWECAVANKIGLGVALDYAMAVGIPAIEERVLALGAALRDRLGQIPGVMVQDLGEKRCGIVTFTVEGADPAAIRDQLAEQRINVTAAVVSSTRLDLAERGLDSMVRASIHYYNSDEEIDRFGGAVEAVKRAG